MTEKNVYRDVKQESKQKQNKLDRIRPCPKIGEGKPRFIINRYFAKLESLMLHARFLAHQTTGSEANFLKFAYIRNGHDSHFGYVA